jgi:phosphoribosylanthranilate isomerase
MSTTPLVKICGIRRAEDARLAAALGAAAIGFVFWPDSPRFIDPYRARPIARLLPPFVTRVGVFVDQPHEYVRGVARLLNLGAIQLHGHESADDVAALGRAGAPPIIKAVAVTDTFHPAAALASIPDTASVLLDAHDPIKRGGTGRTIDWTLAAAAARLRPVILSGGLKADNVAEAIAHVQPYAVDISSGVESAPGVKDADKLRALFSAVTQAGAESASNIHSQRE